MSGFVFLLIAIGISVVGSLVLFARHRAPTSMEHGVTEFQREMRALAPRPDQAHVRPHDPNQQQQP